MECLLVYFSMVSILRQLIPYSGKFSQGNIFAIFAKL